MRSVPIGAQRNTARGSRAFQLEKGDVFVAYTDGISESENLYREFWGQERLESLLRACRDCGPAQIISRILDDVLRFGKDCPQKDDMTLVVIGVNDAVGQCDSI